MSTAARQHKRTRKNWKSKPPAVIGACHLSILPFELLAETALYLSSPKDLLAIARCSKGLADTLTSPDSYPVWRRCRKTAGIPDPTPNFTEPSYAALLFDGGDCDVCGTHTKRTYASYALRFRLCTNHDCTKTMEKQMLLISSYHTRLADKPWAMWNIAIESARCVKPGESPYYRWPNYICIPREECDAAELEHLRAVKDEEYKADCDWKTLRVSAIMTHAVELDKWREDRKTLEGKVKSQNMDFLRALASEYGWSSNDLMASPTYRMLHEKRNNCLEMLSRQDTNILVDVFAHEMVDISRSRENRTSENGLRARQKDIADLHHTLQSEYGAPLKGNPTGSLKLSAKEREAAFRAAIDDKTKSLDGSTLKAQSIALPTFAVFRKLPAIAILEKRDTGTTDGLTREFKTRAVKEMIVVELKRWSDMVRSSLSVTLGYEPHWKTASDKIVHPVDRTNARFRCGRCQTYTGKYFADQSLDFAGVCRHECLLDTKKLRDHFVWDVNGFVKDDKACAALDKALQLCEKDPQYTDAALELEKIGTRIACLSCPANIVMNVRSLAGHSHRHELMDITLVSESDAAAALTFRAPVGPLPASVEGQKPVPVAVQPERGPTPTGTSKPRIKGSKPRLPGFPQEAFTTETRPINYGLCDHLREPSQRAKTHKGQKKFVCRHCVQARQTTSEGDAEMGGPEPEVEKEKEDDAMESGEKGSVSKDVEMQPVVEKRLRGPDLFIFHGLVSHLKTKHEVPSIRDEDVWCTDQPLIFDKKKSKEVPDAQPSPSSDTA